VAGKKELQHSQVLKKSKPELNAKDTPKMARYTKTMAVWMTKDAAACTARTVRTARIARAAHAAHADNGGQHSPCMLGFSLPMLVTP
jgi:hypothetical protein